MKRTLFSLILALIFLAGLPVLAEEADAPLFRSGDYSYTLLDDGTAELRRYHGGDATDLTLPGQIAGIPVTRLGENLFAEQKALCSVTLPEGLTHIGRNAFYFCSNLEKVALPETLLGIGDEAFRLCYSLRDIHLPEGVTSIGDRAFHHCTPLQFEALPASLSHLGREAFFLCASLTSVELPSSLTSVGDAPFRHCERLTEIRVAPENPALYSDEGVLYSLTDHRLVCYPEGRPARTYTVLAGTERIDAGAFASCTLEEIILPEGLLSIGELGIAHCDNLASLELPSTLTTLEPEALRSNNALTAIVLPEGMTELPMMVFKSCKGLRIVTLPASLEYIAMTAFQYCDLQYVVVPRDSYAKSWARENNVPYKYAD